MSNTLQEAALYYGDLEKCVQRMLRMRWADGVTCPHCESKEVTRINMRPLWQCRSFRKQFTPEAGTIIEDTPIGLDKWLGAIWMLTNCENGASSMGIHRAIGLTQKTPWFVLRRIRYALDNDSMENMTGIVEADETYIGGKEVNKRRNMRVNAGGRCVGKAIVMGVLDRGGGAVE
ncbi:MAG: IS1595 family transposase [Capsulimonadaceae bacterium]|nr:IS1595 family transposase [Capsulimonadaceae bacterium]